MDQHAEAVGREAEQAVGRPIDEGARVEEQEHRCQEAHEWRDQPQEAEALLHAVPGGDAHRQDRQDHQQDQERDALHGLVRIRDSREDTNPGCFCHPPHGSMIHQPFRNKLT